MGGEKKGKISGKYRLGLTEYLVALEIVRKEFSGPVHKVKKVYVKSLKAASSLYTNYTCDHATFDSPALSPEIPGHAAFTGRQILCRLQQGSN